MKHFILGPHDTKLSQLMLDKTSLSNVTIYMKSRKCSRETEDTSIRIINLTGTESNMMYQKTHLLKCKDVDEK